jgi:hypothetical protein
MDNILHTTTTSASSIIFRRPRYLLAALIECVYISPWEWDKKISKERP